MKNIEIGDRVNLSNFLNKSGVLFDRGCFLVTTKGTQLVQESNSPRVINSFSDLCMFDELPDRIRAKGKRELRYWIQAKNRRG